MRLPALSLLGVILSLGVATSASGQSPGGSIQGVVRAQAGPPLEAATVVLVGTRYGAASRDQGRYSITGVPPGTYRVRASRLGFAAREQQVVVSAGAVSETNFELSTAAVQLERVVATGYGTQ